MTSSRHRKDIVLPSASPRAPMVRSCPSPQSDFKMYRESLRWDAQYSCSYCTVAEVEAGGINFSIDHYYPRSRYPELANDYSNLFYCCCRCNSYKREYPTELESEFGMRLYRPDVDDPDDHFLAEDGAMRLKPVTKSVGEYSIERLYLNGKILRDVRQLRMRLARSKRVMLTGLRALQGMRIDTLPKDLRVRFANARACLSRDVNEVDGIIDGELIAALNRSTGADQADTRDHNGCVRREYLLRINALVPNDSRNRG